MNRMSSTSAAAPARPTPRVGGVAPSRQPVAARPVSKPARETAVPWPVALIAVVALVMAGVLIIVLARLVAMPAVSPGFVPGPAPLSRSQNPDADESETHDWQPDPRYVR
jgi:hypothetical protein